ncbi:hypothetical protein chiPu_0016810 [Chiloscyllium punctatum]|uniref:Uncharacterized protein n=1 Tax=Chiloscyllium punctatum TaxID=137246 RepID=A0A401T6L3_CHIPU|nr:hypothetical protein [Chiloscyllium punctatum]
MNVSLGFLSVLLVLAHSSERWRWNYRDGADKVNINGIYSVTRLLNYWGNGIFKQVKDTMINQPSNVLPDYSRIQPLSEALDDLFKEIRTMKKRLADLTENLAALEKVFSQVGYGKPVKIKRVVMRKAPRKVSVYQIPQRIPVPKQLRPLSRRRQ